MSEGRAIGASVMGPIQLSVARWAAWAPGLQTPESWAAWAASEAPAVPVGIEAPPLVEVAPMTRRRIERQGRLAFQVAAWCQAGTEPGSMPAIFASRHGDPARSFELLSTLASGDALSPTDFGLSVHNAIGGQYSMVRKDTSNFVSIASGQTTTESAFVEAAGLLAQGHSEVLVVVYDASLPAAYVPFADEPQADFAWAMRVSKPRADLPEQLSLTFTAERTEPHQPTPSRVPHALEVLRFFLSRAPSLSCAVPHGRWVWSRGA